MISCQVDTYLTFMAEQVEQFYEGAEKFCSPFMIP